MEILLLFLLTAFISFLGSVQLGPVNTCVIRTTIYKGIGPAFRVALGGIIPEIMYSLFAVLVIQFAVAYTNWLPAMNTIASIAIGGYGIYLLFQANKKTVEYESQEKNGNQKPFWMGFTLALLNPMLLPFWTAVLTRLQDMELFKVSNFQYQLAFILGSATGAFCILSLFIAFTHRNRKWIRRFSFQTINYFFGFLLIGLGILNFLVN